MITRKAQSTLEYVFLVMVVTVGLVAMQIYLKRGLQGRLRVSSDDLSEAQYSPGQTVSDMTTFITLNTSESSANALSQAHSEETRIRTNDRETVTWQ